MTDHPLGAVVQGSLSQGLEVRLHSDVSVEQMRVGKFLVVQNEAQSEFVQGIFRKFSGKFEKNLVIGSSTG